MSQINEGYICAKPKKRINKKDLTLKNNEQDKNIENKIVPSKLKFKRLNIYKNYILNKDYKYKTFFKEYSLLDFVLNKFKNKKYKDYRFNLLN